MRQTGQSSPLRATIDDQNGLDFVTQRCVSWYDRKKPKGHGHLFLSQFSTAISAIKIIFQGSLESEARLLGPCLSKLPRSRNEFCMDPFHVMFATGLSLEISWTFDNDHGIRSLDSCDDKDSPLSPNDPQFRGN
jgi:hypothetical protein